MCQDRSRVLLTLPLSFCLCRFGPFGEFVVEVHGSLGLRGSPGPTGASVAKEVLRTLTGVGTICVDTPSMATAPVRPG